MHRFSGRWRLEREHPLIPRVQRWFFGGGVGWGEEWRTAKRSSLREEEETPCHLCEDLEIPLIHPDARHTVENYKIEISSLIRASPQHS